MSYECFDLQRAGGVAHLVLNRPQAMNAMNAAFWRELPGITAALVADRSVRALVISSTGKHFTAGMDFAMFSGEHDWDTQSPEGRERLRARLIELQRVFRAIAEARFPVIAAVHGACIGGGVDLVAGCCLRYATRDASFVIQEINLGIMADLGTLQRLPKALPEAIVRELGLDAMFPFF